MDEEQPSEGRQNRTDYLLLTFDGDYPGLGRVRVFDMLKRAEDAIADDRREPAPYIESAVIQPLVPRSAASPEYLYQHALDRV